jgi:TonB-linked SusC/RagA family outer membrane protein
MLLSVGLGATWAQTIITGRVVDEKGQPLTGVTISVKGSPSIGTVTDIDGNYRINSPSAATLVFQYIGYASQEVIASAAGTVQMRPSARELNGTIVTALAIKREKRDIGYSATTLSNADLTSGNNVSALSAIQGKTAGANITSATGGPGGSTRIVLRGEKSVNSNNNALIVVDGIPVNNASRVEGISLLSQIDFGNQGNDINPDDIESITVLKGPAAAALYGSQAANGAVMITTKSGRNRKGPGKTEITVQSKYTLSNILKYPDFQNKYGQGNIYAIEDDRRENFSWGLPFDGQLRPWGQEINGRQQVKPYAAQEDNIKSFFDIGKTLENSVSLAGGTDRTSFYLSLDALNNRGVVPNTFYDKYSIRLNTSTELSNKFYANVNINYLNINSRVETQGQSANGQGAVWDNLLQTPRDIPVWELADLSNPYYGYGFVDTTGISRYGYYGAYALNPYWVAENFDNRNKTDRIIGATTIGYKPNANWNIYDRIGGDVLSDRTFRKIPKYDFTPFDDVYYSNPDGSPQKQTNNGGYFEGTDTRLNLYNDLIVNYNKRLSEDIGFDGTLGHNLQLANENTSSGDINPITNGLVIPGYYNLSNNKSQITAANSTFRRRQVGVYGDLRLDYKRMVFLELTGRNDWFSTLAEGNRSFFYPSANMSWIFTETFKNDVTEKVLTYGKLRGGYASVGNGATPYQNNNAGFSATQSQTSFGIIKFPFVTPEGNNVPGFSLGNTIGNPGLLPERTNSSEVGVDLGFFRDRASLEFTYYSNSSIDQIISTPVAPSAGYTSAIVNVGEISNKGVELSARISPISTKDFRWDVFGTYTKNKNRVESLSNGVSQILLDGSSVMGVVAAVGREFGTFYGTDLLTDASGHVIVDSVSGLPKLAPNAVYKGSFQPRFIASWGTTFRWKGLSFNMLFVTKQGGKFYSATKDLMDFCGTAAETENRDPYVFPNSVYQSANGTYVPNTTKFLPYDYYTNVIPAGQHVIDASYVKLQEASLYYTLPSKWFNKSFFGGFTIGVYGSNLAIWTSSENKYVDPEVTSGGASNVQGYDYRARPSLRNFGMTIKATF